MSNDHKELIAAYLEGKLDQKSKDQLFEYCQQDSKLLDELAGSLEVERMIEFLGTYDEDANTFKSEVLHRITQNDTVNTDFTPNIIERIESQDKWRKYGLIAAAASILFIATCIGFLKFTGNGLAADSPQFATITSLESVAWEQGQPYLALGDRLQYGVYSFSSGSVQFEMDNGTKLLIEGPASFELVDNKHINMKEGRITVHVSEAGKGFVLENPSGKIIDLGRLYCVDISADGITQHQVVKGSL